MLHCASAAKSGSHCLQFVSTGRLQRGAKPHFEQLTVFDGVRISHCDRGTRKEQFKPILESHNLTEDCEAAFSDVHDVLKEISGPTTNHTLYIQRRRGCITSAEGLDSAFDIWAVDGEDFIQFDAGAQKWKALSSSAQTIKGSWDEHDLRNDVFGHFIKERCPLMIQQIKLREVEQRTDLRVFAEPINSIKVLLVCHVTSTDRSVSSVSLTEDGATKANWINVTGPLPSGDGAVILRLTAEVPLIYRNIYGCVVEEKKLTVMWDGNTLDGTNILYRHDYLIIMKVLGPIVFLILAGILIKFWRRMRKSFCKTNPKLHQESINEELGMMVLPSEDSKRNNVDLPESSAVEGAAV